MSGPNIVLICDYGIGDPAFTEVSLQLRRFSQNLTLFPISTPPFSTINTGFWVYQIALSADLINTFIYSNTAPRKHEPDPQHNNAGEELMYAKLKNGFEIMAVNAGHTFSFIKPYITEFAYVNVQNMGSQFRSRDYYPEKLIQLVNSDYTFKGKAEDPSVIPDYPRNVIASIDGYGNIKTSTRLSEIIKKPGDSLTITLNGVTKQATFTDGSFNVPEGSLAFAPGSSGHENRFMELFLRGASAVEFFNNPSTEEPFTLS